jgi:hypothetical protein
MTFKTLEFVGSSLFDTAVNDNARSSNFTNLPLLTAESCPFSYLGLPVNNCELVFASQLTTATCSAMRWSEKA